MDAFAGMEGLLSDFLPEAWAAVAGVDTMLVDLERSPQDRDLLYEVSRGFHTVKGGASFLTAVELTRLCDLGERLAEKLRNRDHAVLPQAIGALCDVTKEIREMLSAMARGVQPAAASADLVLALERGIVGDSDWPGDLLKDGRSGGQGFRTKHEPDWHQLYAALMGAQAENARVRCNEKAAPDRTDGTSSSAAGRLRARQAEGGSGAGVSLHDGPGSSVASRPEVGTLASMEALDPTVRDLVEMLDLHLGVLVAGLEKFRRDSNRLLERFRRCA